MEWATLLYFDTVKGMVDDLKKCVNLDEFSKEKGFHIDKVIDVTDIISPSFLESRYSGIWVLKPSSNFDAKSIVETIQAFHETEDDKNVYSVECLEVSTTTKENNDFTVEFFKDLGVTAVKSFASLSLTTSSSASISPGQKKVKDYNDIF